MTHKTTRSALDEALAGFEATGVVEGVPVAIRVEGGKRMSPILFRDFSLESEVSKSLLKHDKDRNLSEEETQRLINKIMKGFGKTLEKQLIKSSKSMIKARRQEESVFTERTYKRWKKPLNHLRVIWEVSQEVCQSHAQVGPRDIHPLVFDVLSGLHPRALLVVSEIICLLEGGFPDAALARWRSLHELVVTAMFISQHGEPAAKHYRASAAFAAYRAAEQIERFAERAKMEPFSQRDMSALRADKERATQEIGRELDGDWDWAAVSLNAGKANFAEVEAAVGLDHWRPRYKWASQHIHSPHRVPSQLLGNSESVKLVHLIGGSNSGFVDPLHMTAISIFQSTITFLFSGKYEMEHVIVGQVLSHLTDEVGKLAQESQTTIKLKSSKVSP